VPVVRPSLSFFMKAKVVYDGFPNRIWAFSSANLGLSVWKLYKQQKLTHVVDRRHQNRLDGMGLPTAEHYPVPAKTGGSLGRCHRRPCGLDSGVITPSGVVTNPIEQIRWLIRPRGTPSFDQILSAYWTMLDTMYEDFLSGGEALDHCRLSAERRRALVAECRAVVEEVKDWVSRGCPIDKSVLAEQPKAKLAEQPKAKKVVQPAALTSEPELVTHMISSTREGGGEGKEQSCTDADPDYFCQVDLPRIIENGEWMEFVRFLVEHGIPCEGKFYEVISTLARWFCFVEFYDRPEKSTSQLLMMYVLRKNNGMVSRLHNGETHEVFAHVDRIVEEVL
jgi:hypothetical protein